jgi:hypothetical protein
MDRIVAKSSGAARLNLEQMERQYFAINILTFYKFINIYRFKNKKSRPS